MSGAAKGTRLYIEGTLKLEEWNDKDGFARHGLSCAAWNCARVGASAIGRNKPKRTGRPDGRSGEDDWRGRTDWMAAG